MAFTENPHHRRIGMRMRSCVSDLKGRWGFGDKLLTQNAGWTLLGNGARLLFQGVYFVLIARILGAHQYGTFITVTAAAAIVSPLVGNGFSSLMIKHVAHDATRLPEAFGNVLLVTLGSGLLLSALLIPACLTWLPHSIPFAVIVMLLAADVLLIPYVTTAGVVFWSLERMGWTAALNALISLSRLLGIVVIMLLHRPTLMAWSVTYLITSSLCAMIGLACALSVVGKPRPRLETIRTDLKEGFYFSTSLSAQTIYNDIDKTLLGRLSTLESVGIYGAAYRLIDFAFTPINALLSAAYPSFFRHGRDGIHTSLRYGRGLAKRILPYSLLASVALFAGAPLVSWVLGHQYAEVTEALRWLAVLPLLKTVHYFIADALTGAGYQGSRTLVQAGVAVFNILINLWVIPAHGWRGAAWSSIASDALLALGLAAVARHIAARAPLRCEQPEPAIVG